MKLHSPCRFADPECVDWSVFRRGQVDSPFRKSQDRFLVGRLGRESSGQPSKQGIVRRFRTKTDIDRPDLAPSRIGIDRSAEGLRQELMSVTDAKDRQTTFDGLLEPDSGPEAPGQSMADHRRRSGDDGRSESFRRGQLLRPINPTDKAPAQRHSQSLRDPVLKIPARLHGIDGLAGFDDQTSVLDCFVLHPLPFLRRMVS